MDHFTEDVRKLLIADRAVRIVVAGSRGFDDFERMQRDLGPLLDQLGPIEVVSGTAEGADELGERWARNNGCKVTRFPPAWPRTAAQLLMRNEKMAEYADGLVAFWDGRSSGTRHMIAWMAKLRKPHVILGFRKPRPA